MPMVAVGAATSRAVRSRARVHAADAMLTAAADDAMSQAAGSSALVQVVGAQSMVAVSATMKPVQVGQSLGYLAVMQKVYPSPQYDIQSRVLRTQTRINTNQNGTEASAACCGQK